LRQPDTFRRNTEEDIVKALTTKLIILTVLLPGSALSDDTQGWLVRAYGGASFLDDQDVEGRGVSDPPGDGDVNLDTGFVAGLGLGYRYSERIAVELALEYRSHDSDVSFDSGERFDGGNYASNTIWLNGFYHLARRGRWQPYLGAGIGYIEEIDIDLDRRGEKERSFSDDGDVAWQVFAGINYRLGENWDLHTELRYSYLEDVSLDEESGTGRLSELDYDPLTLQIGVSYRF
jgi:opacity protein-like surface antigen